MRLIDADAIREEMISMERISRGFISAAKLIDDAPTVDAVPVVRCIDCKYYSFTCERKMIADAKPDDFCSRGVRFIGAKMDGGAEDEWH